MKPETVTAICRTLSEAYSIADDLDGLTYTVDVVPAGFAVTVFLPPAESAQWWRDNLSADSRVIEVPD